MMKWGEAHHKDHQFSRRTKLTLALCATQFSMVNNADTGGTESAGTVHDMSEETWDFVMYVLSHVCCLN